MGRLQRPLAGVVGHMFAHRIPDENLSAWRRTLKSAERPTTAIAWAFPDRVIVRDEDLCSSLIGHLSLTEYFHFVLLGCQFP
jgi:hypothetical protein